MAMLQWPYVARSTYDALLRRYDNDLGLAREREVRIEARARAAEERSVEVLREARLSMVDAYALVRSAADTLFPKVSQDDDDYPQAKSVAEADREAAERAAERNHRR